MKKSLFTICLLAISIALTATADVYNYVPVSGPEFSGSWDLNSNWFNATSGSRISPLPGYPNLAGDVAIIQGGGTNAASNAWQLWPNMYTNIFANVGVISVSISNEMLLGNSGSPGAYRLILNDPSGKSVIALTNMVPDNHLYLNQAQLSTYWDMWFILSNDLEITSQSVPYLFEGNWYEDAASIAFDVDTRIYGDYEITKNGRGNLMIGNYYGAPTEPQIRTTKPFTVNGCAVIISEGARIDPPFRLNSITDCKNEAHRTTLYNLGAEYDIDLVMNGAFFNFDDPWGLWPAGTNAGTLTVQNFALIDPDNGLTFRFINDVNGSGEIYKGYNDEASGELDFTGSISPGINDIDYLYFRSLFNSGMHFGASRNAVDINIQINGMRDEFGVDADAVAIQGESSVPLNYINLNLFTDGHSNPYRTNEVMYSYDGGFLGSLNSIVWSDPNRTGEVIVTPESVYVTGVPPLSNFFDIYKDKVVLVQGETQQILIARSPFEMDVNAVADESWISVQPVISLSNDAQVSVSVTVPANQSVTNDFGLSKGTIRFSSVADPSIYIDESVYVVEPGYFELDKTKLFFIADRLNTATIYAESFLTVNVNINNQGGSWITLDKSSISITNNRKSVGVEIPEQPAGTTGTIRFENDDVLGLIHDVAVEVVENGYFEVSPTTLEFVTGETQKYINVSSPFRADVNINSTDSWVAVSSFVSLDENGYSVPVVIPASQAVGSTGTITFVNPCFTNFTFDVEIIVASPCGDFTVNTNLLEFVTGVDSQQIIKVSSETCANVTIQPISSSWISVTNNIYLLNNTTDVTVTIPIDQADGSTGMVRFTSIEDPTISYDVDVIVVPEPFVIVSLLVAIGALAFRRIS